MGEMVSDNSVRRYTILKVNPISIPSYSIGKLYFSGGSFRNALKLIRCYDFSEALKWLFSIEGFSHINITLADRQKKNLTSHKDGIAF